ncbi:hypothetical protein [Streptomyces sp. NPDC056663]|uniref:hypothetical protein n=1 Tax=Streptomyces sp. NPDC056663 TaxID=3345899 RepID=UPI0036CAD391
MPALVAIYALLPGQLTHLRRTDLDRSKGRLRPRRAGRLDHVSYLDAFTLPLTTAWGLQRPRRWPDSSNPYFFVTRNTAVDDSGPSPVPAWFSCSSNESACPPTACVWTASSTRRVAAPTRSV